MLTQTLDYYHPYLLKAQKIVIAYSGGVDSHVLLHLCVTTLTKRILKKLQVIHIHHGLLLHADNWSTHCKKICEALRVPFKIIRVKVPKIRGESLENTARIARYAAFSKLIHQNDVLLVAHHQNDQAETSLLQLLRGSGIQGLAAMPMVISFHQGFLLRPLLSITRKNIIDYAKKNHLYWVEDESNTDTRFTRNFLRQKVIPLLESRWPSFVPSIYRVSTHCSEANELLKELAKQDLLGLQGSQPNTLSCSALLKLPWIRQKNAIRYWLSSQKIPLPSTIKLSHLMFDVVQAKADRKALVSWGKIEARKYQDNLYILKKTPVKKLINYPWNVKKDLQLPGIGVLQIKLSLGCGLKKVEKVIIAFRKGGEKCRLPNRSTHHSLKKLFQEWKIPPWERDQIPLVFINYELAAVVGYCVCKGFEANDNEEGFEIILKKLPLSSLKKDKGSN